MTKPRLSFIATRRNGVETIRFAGLPRPFIITQADRGAYDVGVLRYPDRRSAFADVLDQAQFALDRQQRNGF